MGAANSTCTCDAARKAERHTSQPRIVGKTHTVPHRARAPQIIHSKNLCEQMGCKGMNDVLPMLPMHKHAHTKAQPQDLGSRQPLLPLYCPMRTHPWLRDAHAPDFIAEYGEQRPALNASLGQRLDAHDVRHEKLKLPVVGILHGCFVALDAARTHIAGVRVSCIPDPPPKCAAGMFNM